METITQEIFTISQLTLELVVKSDNSFSVKSFTSKANHTYVNVKYSSYFVFSYRQKNDDNSYSTEKVYFSYPNIYALKKTFRNIINTYIKNKNEIFIEIEDDERGVVVDSSYSRKVFKIEGAKKTIHVRFQMDYTESTYQEGVDFLVNGKTNVVFISIDNLFAIYDIIDNFNLQLASQNLVLIAANRKRTSRDDCVTEVVEE